MPAKTVQVRYLHKITSPEDRKGEVGEVRTLPLKVAQRLVGEGHVEIVVKKTTKK